MRSLLYSLLLVVASLPVLVYGQGKVYSPLVNIPGNGANGFEEYISFLYGASISVAALLAVVKIIIAGAKYMMSDVITNKGEALSDIQGAILGLLLILGAVIILEFINPQLIKRDIEFKTIADAPKINPKNSVGVDTDGKVTVAVDECLNHRVAVRYPSETFPFLSPEKGYTKIDYNNCSFIATPNNWCLTQTEYFGLMTSYEGATIKRPLEERYLACMEALKSETQRYCLANSGRYGEQTSSGVITYACQLPALSLGAKELNPEFAEYKARIAELPTEGSVEERAATIKLKDSIKTMETPTVEIFKELCRMRRTGAVGNWFTKDSPLLSAGQEYSKTNDVSNYRCIRY